MGIKEMPLEEKYERLLKETQLMWVMVIGLQAALAALAVLQQRVGQSQRS